MDEIMGSWRQWHNGEFNKLYSLQNIITIFKSRRIGWERHVTKMKREEDCLQDFGGKAKRKETTRNTQTQEGILLKYYQIKYY
jgi:hypothetical protein